METRPSSRHAGRAAAAALLAWTILLPAVARAEEGTFPADSGVVDVTKPPYLARGDGSSDDTAALRRALLENANRGKVLFLPAGPYLISDTLAWSTGDRPDRDGSNIILQGQSRERTIVKLKDGCPGFDDAAE